MTEVRVQPVQEQEIIKNQSVSYNLPLINNIPSMQMKKHKSRL